MKPPATATFPVETLTIRLAVSADTPALRRLAELDSAPQPEPVPMLVAEVGGELRAALPIGGGPAIADPFQRTAELIAMLSQRARQLEPSASLWPARRRRPLSQRGLAHLWHSVELAERAGSSQQAAFSLALVGRSHFLRGELDDARGALERSFAAGRAPAAKASAGSPAWTGRDRPACACSRMPGCAPRASPTPTCG